MVIKPDNTNGAAILGVLNKVSATADKGLCMSKGSVATCGSGRLAKCHESSVKFIFRFCGLIPGLATLRGIRLTLRVDGSPLSTRTILRRINLKRQGGGFPTRLSNNRRRQISVTETLTGGPGLLLYSRPANTLSCGAKGSVLGLLRGVYERGKVAIVVVARGRTLTPVTSQLVRVGGKRMTEVRSGRGPASVSRVR